MVRAFLVGALVTVAALVAFPLLVPPVVDALGLAPARGTQAVVLLTLPAPGVAAYLGTATAAARGVPIQRWRVVGMAGPLLAITAATLVGMWRTHSVSVNEALVSVVVAALIAWLGAAFALLRR